MHVFTPLALAVAFVTTGLLVDATSEPDTSSPVGSPISGQYGHQNYDPSLPNPHKTPVSVTSQDGMKVWDYGNGEVYKCPDGALTAAACHKE